MGMPLWSRDATFLLVVFWLPGALLQDQLVDTYTGIFSGLETKQISFETPEGQRWQNLEREARREGTKGEGNRSYASFSTVHLSILEKVRRALAEQYANHTATQDRYYSEGGCRREGGCGSDQRRRGSRGGRSGKRTSKAAHGAEGLASGAETSACQIHSQAPARVEALGFEQVEEAQVDDPKKQRKNRGTRYQVDGLCPDVPEELEGAKANVPDKPPRGTTALEAESGALGPLAEGAGFQGECRRAHRGRGDHGDGGALRFPSSASLGGRHARRRWRRRWFERRVEQGLQCTPTIRQTKQEGKDGEGQEIFRGLRWQGHGGIRSFAWFFLFLDFGWPSALPDGYLRGGACPFDFDTTQKACTHDFEYDLEETNYLLDENAVASYYNDGNNTEHDNYLQDFDKTESDDMNENYAVIRDYCMDDDKVRFAHFTINELLDCICQTNATAWEKGYQFGGAIPQDTSWRDQEDSEHAPSISRLLQNSSYAKRTQHDLNMEYSSSTPCEGPGDCEHFEGFSEFEVGLLDHVLLLDSVPGKHVMVLAALGIFLFSFPLLMMWMLALCFSRTTCRPRFGKREHLDGDLDNGFCFFVASAIGLLSLPLFWELDAFKLSSATIGQFCGFLTKWCLSNKSAVLVIFIMIAYAGLCTCQIVSLFCGQCRLEKRSIWICRRRKVVRRKTGTHIFDSRKLMIWYLFFWNHYGALAGNVLTYGDHHHHGSADENELNYGRI